MSPDLVALRRSLSDVATRARDTADGLGGRGTIDGLGVTVQLDGHVVFGGVNAFAAAVDDLQYDLGEGPCLQAQHHGMVVASRTIATGERRWPLFSPRAAQLGLRSVVSAPLVVGTRTPGSLNVYGAAPDRLDHLRPTVVRAVVESVEQALGPVLRDATRTSDRSGRSEDAPPEAGRARDAGLSEAELRRLVATLPVIEQAKGVLMGYYGVDADTAFTVLTRWSSARQTKLRDVCAALVAHVVSTPRPDLAGGLQSLLEPPLRG